jgi:regulator of replication initiation timing
MSQETQKQFESNPIMAQISLLNLRINDMMTQLNAVMKTLVEENQALQKENTELKQKPTTTQADIK